MQDSRFDMECIYSYTAIMYQYKDMILRSFMIVGMKATLVTNYA